MERWPIAEHREPTDIARAFSVTEALTVGLKLTHDASVAATRGSTTSTIVELEKLGRRRFARAMGRADIELLLKAGGALDDTPDLLVVDGWFTDRDGYLQLPNGPRIRVAPYAPEYSPGTVVDLESELVPSDVLGRAAVSVPHVISHVYAALGSAPGPSPARDYVLVWDGGVAPALFEKTRSCLSFIDTLFPIALDVYSRTAMLMPPFGPDSMNAPSRDRLDVAGKVMAFIATAKEQGEPAAAKVADVMSAAMKSSKMAGITDSSALARRLANLHYNHRETMSPADVLAGLHFALERALRMQLDRVLPASERAGSRLSVVGGAGLNIKWNAALRRSGSFDSVWVPPFPNDSGVAFGAAVAGRAAMTGEVTTHWRVHSGPTLKKTRRLGSPASPANVAAVLADGHPVMVLDGPAEVGPRALGGRSILADPRRPEMRDRLNAIKGREPYRPIAPLCLEKHAPDYFEPGTPDPYMVFEHKLNQRGRELIPAIVHLDGTARLQTINEEQNPLIFIILTEFQSLTGVPVLCNTSANRNGRGFFDSVEKAIRWGGVPHVYSDGKLFLGRKASR